MAIVTEPKFSYSMGGCGSEEIDPKKYKLVEIAKLEKLQKDLKEAREYLEELMKKYGKNRG